MSSKQGELFGHPKGLYVLFFTEMWERFSYYGMRALLVLYMVNYFKWTQADASKIYKWYTSLVYLTPLLGGYLADRYLGNKRAIIIGAVLMAIGHFLMAFEAHEIFYSALIFLIIGNGFFKPNMSTQVGRLYPTNDPRRDSAYTIFYMGINLGAFLSPLVCGWLRTNTRWGFHAGFTAAGIGMLLGLVTYMLFIKWVEEVPESEVHQGDEEGASEGGSSGSHYMTEAEAATTPSVFPRIAGAAPGVLAFLAVVSVVSALFLWQTRVIPGDSAFAVALGGGFACVMGAWITGQLQLAVRDRVLAIFVVAVFVVFFWAAFEQAGNAMNIFADKTTDRYITEPAPQPDIYPSVTGTEESIGSNWLARQFNPVSTEWFQSINALAIFVMAPLFAWMWVALPRKGIHLSIPAKVAIGVFMQAVAFMLMWWSISFENGPSSTQLAALPQGVTTSADGTIVFRDAPDLEDDEAFGAFATDVSELSEEKLHVVNGGRIRYEDGEVKMNGVLADVDRDRMLRATVDKDLLLQMKDLANRSAEAAEGKEEGQFEVSVTLDPPPPAFDVKYAGMKEENVSYDEATGELTVRTELADKDYKGLLAAASDPTFREAMNELYIESAKYKVSWTWLFWFYILCTVGELCLSPVGLSMVSKLAPAKFATMLMGIWLLTNFFGNFFAGFLGEMYGTVEPGAYFLWIAIIVGAAAGICAMVVGRTKAMMHGVN